MKLWRESLVGLCMLLGSCVSISSLPQKAADLDFSTMAEGKTGWSKHQQLAHLEGVSIAAAYEAAKEAVQARGFSLERADLGAGVVLGEHGITMQDWNIVIGVYLKTASTGTDVAVIAQGSKDVGFDGDSTARPWAHDVITSMRNIISQKSRAGVASTSEEPTAFHKEVLEWIALDTRDATTGAEPASPNEREAAWRAWQKKSGSVIYDAVSDGLRDPLAIRARVLTETAAEESDFIDACVRHGYSLQEVVEYVDLMKNTLPSKITPLVESYIRSQPKP